MAQNAEQVVRLHLFWRHHIQDYTDSYSLQESSHTFCLEVLHT